MHGNGIDLYLFIGKFQAGCKPTIRKSGPGASTITATPGWGASVNLIVEPNNCDQDQKYMSAICSHFDE